MQKVPYAVITAQCITPEELKVIIDHKIIIVNLVLFNNDKPIES